MKLDEYFELSQGLVDWYSERNDLYANIDRMFYMDWDMPGGMPAWVMKVVSTDPHDAVMTTVRTFATLKPRFKLIPMMNNEANRNRANEIETAISYNFEQAGRRNDASVVWDVMLSASLYADVAAQVIYLPYQEKILKAMGKDTKRVEAAKRFGDFAFIIHHPGNVYPEWSEYGLEGVLTCRVQSVDEFMNTWGKLANKLVSEKDYQDGKVSYVTSWDYINYEKRCVWGVCSEADTVQVTGNGVMILEEENKLGFIPYAIRRWGNSLSTATNERVMPLLQSIYNSGQWDMLNSMESLDASLTIARAAQPQFAAELPPGQSIAIDNTEPAGVAELPAGTRNFTPLPNQSVDPRLNNMKGQFVGKIWQSSVAKMLNTLEFPSGTPSSSVNQVLATATSSLAPYRMLGENALGEIAHQMLCWLKYFGKEYGEVDLYGQYEDKSKMGQEIRISSKTIDPDALTIKVSLTADLPIDQLQRMNAAVLAFQNFPVPSAELVEDLGYGDPAELAKRRHLEDMERTYLEADRQRIAMMPQMEMQQQQMQMQMEQQQAAQSQQMEAELAAREQEAQLAAAEANASPAMENMGGLMNNPAAGGVPPVQLARGQK